MGQQNVYVELLRVAAERIRLAQNYFTCNAINVAGKDADQLGAARELQAWVHKLLDGAFTLDEWLTKRRRDVGRLYHRDCAAFRTNMRNTRLAWIDWMVEQIEANGGRIPEVL